MACASCVQFSSSGTFPVAGKALREARSQQAQANIDPFPVPLAMYRLVRVVSKPPNGSRSLDDWLPVALLFPLTTAVSFAVQHDRSNRPCGRCGHPYAAHQHYRCGTDCSLCSDCPCYRSKPALFRRSFLLRIFSRGRRLSLRLWDSARSFFRGITGRVTNALSFRPRPGPESPVARCKRAGVRHVVRG
jgi:hypothetical protein